MIRNDHIAKHRWLDHPARAELQVGKDGVNDMLVKQVDEELNVRGMAVVTVLETAPEPLDQIAQQLAQAVNAENVIKIGARIALYRKIPQKPVLKLQ